MKTDLFGIKIDSLNQEEVVDCVRHKLERKEKFWIATPNPEMIVAAQKQEWFREILNRADLAIPDGIGLIWAAKILGQFLKERVAGTDLLERLCQEAQKENWKVAFLGGKKGIAEKALTTLQDRYPKLSGLALDGPQGLKIRDWKLEIGDEKKDKETKEKINQFTPHLLFVGFGMGKQESWILQNLPSLEIGGAMVVGGAFDFYAGEVKRAPLWLRKAGLEWFWRLICQPWRFRRQLNLLNFIWLVLRERFR